MPFHNRKTPRAKWYDYTSAGTYFVTICTKDRVHYFGEIIDGEKKLNELGKYATNHRKQIPNHYPFVCMPNYVYGIILIDDHIKNNNTTVGM